jgi:hypothetical protein
MAVFGVNVLFDRFFGGDAYEIVESNVLTNG